MAFNYSGDPATSPLDQLRFLAQDTDSTFPLLSDEEHTWLVGQWMPLYDSMIFVASIAAAAIARKFTGLVSVSADGVSVSTSELTGRYTEMAKALRQEYKDSLVGAGPQWNQDSPRRFRIGLHDSIEAGLQDYGDYADPTTNPFMVAEYMESIGVFP